MSEESKSKPGLIYKQMSAIMGDLDPISKDRTNTQGQGYKFRGIDDVYNACQPVLAKHKVFSVPKVLEQTREERASRSGGTLIYTILKVEYAFFAEDGSSITATMMGEAMDSGDKSSNKAMSAAQKYAFLQIFSIPTAEPKDTEEETHEVEPRQTRSESPPSALDLPTGEFVIPFGKIHKGKQVRDLDNLDLTNTLAWIRKNNKQGGYWDDFVAHAEGVLGMRRSEKGSPAKNNYSPEESHDG